MFCCKFYQKINIVIKFSYKWKRSIESINFKAVSVRLFAVHEICGLYADV